MTADEAARRLGHFEYGATAVWTVTRGADRTRVAEKHQLRQLATGEFRALLEIDPGTWPGAETGREVVFTGGNTYARGRYAPFRERPTDRGRDARRFRDESFMLGADLAALFTKLTPVARGEVLVLGRKARRYSLASGAAAPAPAAAPPAGTGKDEDTARRAEFLEGRVPLVFEGEMLLDADTGVPLAVKMKGMLSERADPKVRVEFELDAQISGWGDAVAPVAVPKGALADERKPRGVARALDQAGLREKAAAGAAEPEDDEAE
jgi:hypothetical protein